MLVYTCQNTTLLEITCHGSNRVNHIISRGGTNSSHSIQLTRKELPHVAAGRDISTPYFI